MIQGPQERGERMNIYIVKVRDKVSQECYRSLTEAQNFIESRVGEKEKQNEYSWMIEGTKYEIVEVGVH